MKGLVFPIVVDTATGTLVGTSTVDKNLKTGVREQLLNILNCRAGDRVFRGDFGLGIDLIFGNWESKEDDLKKIIVDKLKTFVPNSNITEDEITVTVEGGMVNIFLAYEEPKDESGVII